MRQLMSTLTLMFAFIASAPAQQYDLSWYTIDGGGTMQSSGGPFSFSGTIGQPDAGRLTGGLFELTGGFWFSIEVGDCDEDAAVGLLDHSNFLECLTGPGLSLSAGCHCFDIDRSESVDLADFGLFQTSFTSD